MSKLNLNAQRLFEERYAKNGEKTWEDLAKRVTNFVVKRDEKLRQEAEQLIVNRDFLPNSPCLMNAGTRLPQLSACFKMSIQEDSMAGIFKALADMSEVQKAGGGNGFNFSILREKGSEVNTTKGKASGVVSFMRVFDSASSAIEQGGVRRGANMGVINDDHPDLINTITYKANCNKKIEEIIKLAKKNGLGQEYIDLLEDKKELTYFNISVGCSDKFMDKVVDYVENGIDSDWEFISRKDGAVHSTIKVSKLWNIIVTNAWKCGDPGILFLGTVNKHNPIPSHPMNGTNPCVTGDTLVLTDKGYKEIGALRGEKIKVWNGFDFSEVEVKLTGRNEDILDIEFSDGSTLSCTHYHKFIIKDEGRIEAKNLKVGDKLEKWTYPIIGGAKCISEKFMYTQGVFSGDGTHEGLYRKVIWLYGVKKELLTSIYYKTAKEYDGDRICASIDTGHFNKDFVPDIEYSISNRLSWIAGLIDTDGTLNSEDGSIAITSINKEFLKKTKLMLSITGVHSTLSLNKPEGDKEMPDGKGGTKVYHTLDAYRLIINASNVKLLMELGLRTNRVELVANPNRDASRFITIKSIKSRVKKEPEVFCFNEPKRHAGCFNGIVTANCGEQVLEDYESCNLGSINLLNHLKEDEEAVNIDFNKLRETVKVAVRFLDCVIDANYYPLPEIKEHTVANRKIGLGVMGVADMLYALGVRYGSDEAVKICESVMKFIDGVAYNESKLLGEEWGDFANWDISIYSDYDTPMRNATRTTIAPTGSISMLAGCSSGIEPNFSLGYFRTIKETHSDGEYKVKIINPVLVSELKRREIYSEELVDKILNNFGSLEGLEEIPQSMKDVFITSFDVNVTEHLKMQRAFQKYTDNAVSKTINAPRDFTKEDISRTYVQAYKMGLKGVTVYRDGSLDSQVLVNKDSENKDTSFTSVRPRPLVTDSYTVKLKSGCCDMNATVGFDEEGRLFETRISNSGAGCSAMYAGLGMMVSEAIRLGGDPKRIAKQLRQVICPACVNREGLHGKSCPDVLGKLIENVVEGKEAVEEFTSNGVIKYKVNSSEEILTVNLPRVAEKVSNASVYSECPNCGKHSYVMESQCGHCIECGFTQCSTS